MSAPNAHFDELLDEPTDFRSPPVLVPWGWRLFFALLAGFDIVCLIIGHVPWSGGVRGLDRFETLVIVVVGIGIGLLIAIAAEAVAANRAAKIGLTPQEAALAADDLSILTRPSRAGRASVVPIIALVWVVCTLLAKFVFQGASLPATTVFIGLHALTGLALPVLWRSYKMAHYEFQVWLDEKNAPFDAAAQERTARHRARLAYIRRRIYEAEDSLRERLAKMPRVAPPRYLLPWAMWIPPALALLLDLFLLGSPEAREIALAAKGAGVGKLIWSTLGLWVESCVLIGVVYGLLAWYYQSIADQVSRQWQGRDWSGGLAAVAIEVLYGGIALALLVSLALGWQSRFIVWNVLAATPLLVGVLADIRATAAEHHERSVQHRAEQVGPAPKTA